MLKSLIESAIEQNQFFNMNQRTPHQEAKSNNVAQGDE